MRMGYAVGCRSIGRVRCRFQSGKDCIVKLLPLRVKFFKRGFEPSFHALPLVRHGALIIALPLNKQARLAR